MTTYAATKVVAAREIKMKLRDKTFVYSTIFFLIFSIATAPLRELISARAGSSCSSTKSNTSRSRRFT